jgi:uncharacterized protein (TIGR01244 family)
MRGPNEAHDMTHLKAATIFFAISTAAFGAVASPALAQQSQASAKMLAPGVFVSGPISPADISALKQGGVSLVIDLLPDDDASPQARSAQVEAAARQASVAFAYAPTPSSPLAPAAVEQTAKALSTGGRPALLYCRSGSRAARVWALYEASRPGGLDAAAVSRAVAAAGYSVDDIRAQIEQRVSGRNPK